MATEVGSAYISLVPSAKGFGAAVQRELDKQIPAVGDKSGKQLGDGLARGVEQSGLEQRLRGVFTGIVSLAKTAGIAGGLALGALGVYGLKTAGEMQQVEIAFEGILGSAQKADVFLQQLRDFAAKTPFEFPELARSAKNLLAVGFATEEVIPIMTTLGNVAATLGVGGDAIEGVVRALGQMQGKGKASAEELQQISEQIPGFSAIKSIAEGMGISVAEAFDKMADGAIPADEAIRLILAGMEKFPGAAGAMERQSKTLLGVLSTLKDTVRDALVTGINPALAGLADAVSDAIPAIGEGIGGLGTAIGTLLASALPVLQRLLPILATLADAVGQVLTEAFNQLAPVIDDLLPEVEALLLAFGPLARELITALVPVLRELGPAFLRVATSLSTSLLPVVRALAPVIADLARIFAGLVEAIGPVGIVALVAGRAIFGVVGFIQSASVATVTLGTAMNAAVPAIAAFTAAFVGTTFILEQVFGKAEDLTGKLAELTTAAAELSRVTNENLVSAFDNVIVRYKDTHTNASGLTVTLGAFEEVLSQNVGTAQRLAEQFRDQPALFNAMQAAIERQLIAQRQFNADSAAGAAAVDNLGAAIERLPLEKTIRINYIASGLGPEALDTLAGLALPGAASGGYLAPGWFGVVGEDGPELMGVGPRGAHVINHDTSMRMMTAPPAAGTGEEHWHFYFTGVPNDPARQAREAHRAMRTEMYLAGA